jgi:hypothetical protein
MGVCVCLLAPRYSIDFIHLLLWLLLYFISLLWFYIGYGLFYFNCLGDLVCRWAVIAVLLSALSPVQSPESLRCVSRFFILECRS